VEFNRRGSIHKRPTVYLFFIQTRSMQVLMSLGRDRTDILANLNHAELLKGRMTIAGNSNLSHLLAQKGRKILTLPIVVVHH